MARVIGSDPVPPSSLVPDLPSELDRVIARALAKDPRGALSRRGRTWRGHRRSPGGLATPSRQSALLLSLRPGPSGISTSIRSHSAAIPCRCRCRVEPHVGHRSRVRFALGAAGCGIAKRGAGATGGGDCAGTAAVRLDVGRKTARRNGRGSADDAGGRAAVARSGPSRRSPSSAHSPLPDRSGPRDSSRLPQSRPRPQTRRVLAPRRRRRPQPVSPASFRFASSVRLAARASASGSTAISSPSSGGPIGPRSRRGSCSSARTVRTGSTSSPEGTTWKSRSPGTASDPARGSGATSRPAQRASSAQESQEC